MALTKMRLAVAEPFDFKAPDGSNVLNCIVDMEAGVGEALGAEYLIVSCEPFAVDRYTVASLLLKSRHRADPLVANLKSLHFSAVNALWLKGGVTWTHSLALANVETSVSMFGGFVIADAKLEPLSSLLEPANGAT
jgi:hypothetical protein